MKKKFLESNLVLILSISVTKNNVPAKYNLSSIIEYVDFLIVIQTNHQNGRPDYSLTEAMIDRNIMRIQENLVDLINCGVPASKIVMFVNFVGPLFIMPDNGHEQFNRFLSYQEICTGLMSDEDGSNWEQSENETGSLILWNRISKMIVQFESTRMIANEVRFAIKQGLAGFATSSIVTDDYTGKCGIDTDTYNDFIPIDGVTLNIPEQTSTNFPLLRTINSAIVVTLDEIEQEIAYNENTIVPINSSNEPCSNEAASYFMLNALCAFIIIIHVLSINRT